MLLLFPISLTLFAGWMLWGWSIGEYRNAPWLRRWCGTLFVLSLAVLSFGAGGLTARILTKQQMRAEVTQLFQHIDWQLNHGNTEEVAGEFRKVRKQQADSSDFDVLRHLPKLNSQLEPETQIAADRYQQRL